MKCVVCKQHRRRTSDPERWIGAERWARYFGGKVHCNRCARRKLHLAQNPEESPVLMNAQTFFPRTACQGCAILGEPCGRHHSRVVPAAPLHELDFDES